MIYLVDDDVQLLETIRDVLSNEGYRVAAFPDASQALAKMDGGDRPRLIVSDVRMPGLDGFAFHREVTKRFGTRTIPFLFLSSLDDPDHIVAGLQSGADDYVTKPIDWKVLKAKVASILDARTGRSIPVFVGDLGKLPFVKLLQFCELRSITGEILVDAPGLKAAVPLNAGLLEDDDDTLDLMGRLMDVTQGTFEIRVRPPDFSDIAHAAVEQQTHQPKPGDCPAGLLTGIPLANRLVQIQTECVSHPKPAVVTVAILDGRTLSKKVLPVQRFDDRGLILQHMRRQHRAFEQDVTERLSRKAADNTEKTPSILTRFNELFEQGLIAYQAKDYEQALDAWSQAAELDPDNKVVQVNLTMLEKKLRND